MMSRTLSSLLASTLLVGSSPAEQETAPSFEQYTVAFDKTYPDLNEYERRRSIFFENVADIQQHNRHHKEYGYRRGINQFTDKLASEVYPGYAKALKTTAVSRHPTVSSSTITRLESLVRTEPVSSLPDEVDWRRQGISTPVKNQYACGSCWAFATTSAIESHVALQTDLLFDLSEQELVSCAANPHHCGGTGGCEGSIAETAMEYVRKRGIVDAWTFGYASKNGTNVACTLDDDGEPNDGGVVDSRVARKRTLKGAIRDQGNDSKYLSDAVASIDGWVTLPRNNYTAVMNAVAKLGPLIVTVACVPWVSYQSGVFSGALKTPSETNLDHLVVLEGYGTDKETGEDYWLIKNSFGVRWGESGYIRLKQVDPETLEDPETNCGIDETPANGVACTIDNHGNPVHPPFERICGTSGILYDVSVPFGAHLV